MIINNNISSIFANRQASLVDQHVSKNMEQLSSGMRINHASDDASGLAISEKMRTQIRGIRQAMKNVQDGISFLQTTEGYLEEVTSALQRIRELAIQGANEIYTDEDRGYLNLEVKLLVDEIDRIAGVAQFNTMKMLDGRFAPPNNGDAVADAGGTATQGGILLHIGPNQDNNVRMYIRELSSQGLGLKNPDGTLTVETNSADKANLSIGRIDAALKTLTTQRTELGAYQNRFENVNRGLYIAYENTSAAESGIRDANMANTVSDLVKNQILQQTSISMIAQANLKTQMILSLLK